ncbi:MAG: AMP-binding protein [Vicinamibacteria bacterium]|nr:AMP-binding protein [Vicinamibacteria bacterium]
MTEIPPVDPTASLQAVLDEARALAAEAGGPRAAAAVTESASLEREVGLGSLERVELLSRLERRFGRRLDESHLRLDTLGELARALSDAPGATPLAHAAGTRGPELAPATADLTRGARTLPEALWRRADGQPDRPAVFLREDGAGEERTITYAQLRDAAAAVAWGLRERGVGRGDTVALMLPTGFDFLRAFQGILAVGAVPVPIYPPVRLDRLEEYALRQSAILADAGVKLLVTIDRARPVAGLLRSRVPSLLAVVSAGELADTGGVLRAPQGAGADPAFIQYTSGSTGSPKGVLLTHDNLLANITAIRAGLQAGPTDVGVSWLPLYHDMGLIGSWLFCLHDGLPLALLSPLAFLARPELWLWTLHARRGTMSAAPNFAYELCARKIEDAAIEGLDLSSWRCALNGAEPVNPETLERFAKRFAPYGFRREAMMPVYGLAENSVGLAFPPPLRGPRIDRVQRAAFADHGLATAAATDDADPLRFVCVGREAPLHEIRIVDDAGADRPERAVGRLVFRGPSMTSGYYRKPEATAAITLPGGWLDSGDLAYRADGELYITGRRKDLIIKGGRNLVPQEIEELASQVTGIRKGCVAAVGLAAASTGTEALVVVAETRATDGEERRALAAAVTSRVAEAVGVPPDRVELVPPGSIPKTSSGKIRRAETKSLLERGLLGQRHTLSWATRVRLFAGVARAGLAQAASSAGLALRGAWTLLCAGGITLLAWPLAAVLPPAGVRWLERHGCALVLKLLGVRVEVTGLERVPKDGACVIVSNHASYADAAVLLAALPFPVAFAFKREAIDYPIVGTFLRRAGHLPVERFDAAQSAQDASRVTQALVAGERVVVFPEGTFTAAAGLRPFKLGAFHAAAEAGVSVVPVALVGTRRLLRDGSFVPRRVSIEVHVGTPIAPPGVGGGARATEPTGPSAGIHSRREPPISTGWHGVIGLRDATFEAIASRCGEPRLDLVSAGPERTP